MLMWLRFSFDISSNSDSSQMSFSLCAWYISVIRILHRQSPVSCFLGFDSIARDRSSVGARRYAADNDQN